MWYIEDLDGFFFCTRVSYGYRTTITHPTRKISTNFSNFYSRVELTR